MRHTELIEIRAMSDTPDEAANLANTVAESFLAFRRDQNRRLRIEQEKEHPSPPGLIRDPMVQIVDRAVPPCKTHPA